MLLVELGGNDFLHRIPQNQTESNLKAILAHSRSSGVPVLLLAVPTPSLFGAAVVGLSDDPLFERIATETETPLIRDVLAEVLSKQQFKSDAVHANADGYRKIADGLYAALKDIGYVK